jgi:ribosome-interacting GTPase 1
MPANLPPAYYDAEVRLRASVTLEEKLAALEEMLRLVPKHKGTEKIQAGIKSRIAKLKRQPKKKPGTRGPSHHIPSEGAGQVVLVGPPNSGKSSLVDVLTHASPAVAEYPLTTREATPGMLPYEDVAIQLVDLPPLCDDYVEFWVFDSIRTADYVWLVLAAESALEGLELVERLLSKRAIALIPDRAERDDAPRPGWVHKRAFMVVTGIDRSEAWEDVELLDQLLESPWPKQAVSTKSGEGLAELGRRTFKALGVIRVYSKQPGKPADLDQPFALTEGSTVGDLARAIHQDLVAKFKFARVWGPSAYDGQKVHQGHELAEGDVVEIHI